MRRVDDGRGGPVVGTPKRYGRLMTGRSAKGRKETKSERRKRGRREEDPVGDCTGSAGGEEKGMRRESWSTKGREAARWRESE